MARRIIWIAVPALLIAIYLLAAHSSQPAAPADGLSDRATYIGVLIVVAAVVPHLLYSAFRAVRRRGAMIQRDPSTDVVFSGSVLDVVPMAIAMIGGATGAYVLLSQDAPPVIAWVMACGGLALATVGVIVVLMHIASGPFRLSLSAGGLDYGPFKCGPIDWRDIRSVDLKRMLSSDAISIEVADPEKYFARGFPKIGRNLGRYAKGWASPFVISPRQIHAPSDLLLDAINARLVSFGPASDSKEPA